MERMTVFETLKEKYFKDADSLARFLWDEECADGKTHEKAVNAACFYVSALGKCAYGPDEPAGEKCVNCLRAWLESEPEAEE